MKEKTEEELKEMMKLTEEEKEICRQSLAESKEQKVCVRCKKNKATMTYANSQLDAIHGFTQEICQECYDKQMKESGWYKAGKEQAKQDERKRADDFYNEFDLASNCTTDDKLFKRLWKKYFGVKGETREEELKKDNSKYKNPLITKIGKKYYWGSLNLTKPIKEIISEAELKGIQETKEQAKREEQKKADDFYNEFDLASNCTTDDKLFKRLWKKYFGEKEKWNLMQ